LLNSGFSEEVTNWHQSHTTVPLHFFWDKKNAPEVLPVDDTLSFHQLNDSTFIKYMAGSKAYATTAGFESVCEALYLGKPVLMIPTHIEQACNAFDAEKSGAGQSSSCFDLDKLLVLSKDYKPNLVFKHWVKQAPWLILTEFKYGSLFEPPRPTILKRVAARFIYRLVRYRNS